MVTRTKQFLRAYFTTLRPELSAKKILAENFTGESCAKTFHQNSIKTTKWLALGKLLAWHGHAMFVTRRGGFWVIASRLREKRNSFLWSSYRQRDVWWWLLKGSVRGCASSWILLDVNVIFIDVDGCASVQYWETRRRQDFVAKKYAKPEM